MDNKNPYVFVVLIQILQAGVTLLAKAALNGGMSSFVFIFYRKLAGTVFLLLLSAIFQRRSMTQFTFPRSSIPASLASATIDCVPVTTFFFAVLLRREKVNVREIAGVAKLGGITICMGGVATLAFFKGPILNPSFALHNAQHQHHVSSSGSTTWTVGCFLSFISVSTWGLWYVLQCLSSTVQLFIVAIAVERDLSKWKLAWNVRLLAVLYCGIMVTGFAHYLQPWVIAMKGPIFQAMSTPLNPILTMIGSMFLLGESINVGR
ncbi:hypothetical protein EUGRSUZ_I00256 [Eucalyptus grandis]|uniref:Uncharacterized protein n=2 Tax=Eucalyptus grandis TaxID=71139 RepID=A0ACC3JC93_EUCGR|nr:hypothetical protein EUGRSUZ_I00256 [Eucalyptus grandis]